MYPEKTLATLRELEEVYSVSGVYSFLEMIEMYEALSEEDRLKQEQSRKDDTPLRR